MLRPDVFTAVAGLSVPFSPPSEMRPLAMMRALAGDEEFYIEYFQEPGRAEAEIEADVRGWLRGFYFTISGDAPGETPYAAAIFLHRHSYTSGGATKPTSGCVSLDYDGLTTVLRLLDPALSPHFAIGPTSWLRSTA